MRKIMAGSRAAGFAKTASVLVIGGLLAGCSSDVVRFSDGFYTGAVPQAAVGAVDTPYPSRQPVYQQQAATQPVYRQPSNVDGVTTGSVVRAPGVVQRGTLNAPQVAQPLAPRAPEAPKLAPVSAAEAKIDTTTTASVPAARTASAAPSAGEGWTKAGGTYITVRSGETVYNLAKRYGVPANAILEANGLSDPRGLSAGQQVLIPTYVYSRNVPVSAPDNNAGVRSASASVGGRSEFPETAAPVPGSRPSGTQVASLGATAAAGAQAVEQARGITTGRYTVSSGDTLSAIARRAGTSVDAIKRLNGLSSDTVRLGQSLLIPGIAKAAGAPTQVAAKPVDTVTTGPAKTGEVAAYTPPKADKPSRGAISTIDSTSTASAPASTGVASLRWPVEGRVISAFGSNSGGKKNDGIDISVPKGAPVKAAENGVVIYSGDGLKEFGKTVLVRHENGLVTVYGHLDSISVARGDTVKRGQSLGASGMTGNARQPQLHFEVRKNTSPVDPMTYLR